MLDKYLEKILAPTKIIANADRSINFPSNVHDVCHVYIPLEELELIQFSLDPEPIPQQEQIYWHIHGTLANAIDHYAVAYTVFHETPKLEGFFCTIERSLIAQWQEEAKKQNTHIEKIYSDDSQLCFGTFTLSWWQRPRMLAWGNRLGLIGLTVAIPLCLSMFCILKQEINTKQQNLHLLDQKIFTLQEKAALLHAEKIRSEQISLQQKQTKHIYKNIVTICKAAPRNIRFESLNYTPNNIRIQGQGKQEQVRLLNNKLKKIKNYEPALQVTPQTFIIELKKEDHDQPAA